ncbi:MAG: ligand-binding sensor domain-containing diguanylate cyclase [Dokdonella sp.]|uniref:ligand-binding sensor domain-containing diguanylate cyclase n=1 Tax=Dokdonella sp. TaxID=2291710 RepID=UPI003F7D691C
MGIRIRAAIVGAMFALLVATARAQPDGALEWRAFRSFTSADGLPQNSVLALLQDADGYVYAGTNHGLARYDGRAWHAIDLPTGEQAYAVGALVQARDGALWIGTDAVGAWRIADGVASAVPLPGAEEINAFWEAPDGRLWIAGSGGLFRCRVTRCERIDALGEAGARGLYGEAIDGTWRLWVGTNYEGVIQLEGIDEATPHRSGVVFDRSNGLPNSVGLAIVRHAGDLWIGSGRGLARWYGRRLESWTGTRGLPNAMVFALQSDVDEQGRPVLYAGLRPGGLLEIRADGTWRLIDSQHGLPSNAVASLLRERHRGALWIGTMSAGIARVERHRWALFDERMGLPDRIVLGVGWSAPARMLWVGTASGAARWSDGRFVPLLPPARNTQLVYDLVDAPDGSRWIAHRSGLQRWRGDALELDFTVDNSALPAVSADRLALRHLADGGYELYAASGHGLARWRADEGLRRVENVPGLMPGVAVPHLVAAPEPGGSGEDRVWAATADGLARLDHDGWHAVEAPCLTGLAPFALDVEDGGARLWIASRNGLRRLDADGACAAFPAARELGALTRVRVVGDEVYVFGARGVMSLRRDGGSDQQGRVYGPEAGLSSPEIGAVAVDDRGRVFGATAVGLAALQPEVDAAAARAPLRLLAARHGRAQQPLAGGAQLSPDDSSASFDYGLFAFDREYATRYRVRLLGLEDAFGAWSTATSVAYPRLPPGHYRLQVEARDADGVAAEPIDFAFGVDAHWWQRPWAIAAAALLLLALGLGIGRWRLRAASRRAQALEAEVALRTGELAAANARLEQAAVTDPLTGLMNRRYFALAAPTEAEHARRAPPTHALLVVLLDVDHFKRINDECGHDAGDAVLAEIARRLLRVARAGDIVLRWGGEEFLLLLRDVERSAADEPLRGLLGELSSTPVQAGTHGLAVTASIGAIAFPPADAPSLGLELAIARADAALYRAKREGRARAMRVDPDGDGTPPCVCVSQALGT